MNDGAKLDKILDDFIDGWADFEEFRKVVEDQLSRHPELTEATLQRLDSLKSAGRMSPALHALMANEVTRSSAGDITPPFGEPEPPEQPEPARPSKSPKPPEHAKPSKPPEHARPPKPPEPPELQEPLEASEPPRPASPPSPPGVGSVLAGRYRLDAVLGRGGMSVVYRAVDLQHIGSGPEAARVAVKLLAPEFRGREARRSFEREAALLRPLDHPGVVRLLDSGSDGESTFLVLELLDGEWLRSHLVRTHPAPLPVDQALRVTRELCEALAYLHGQGLVHRDLKPANIFITAAGETRLIDFGLAGTVKDAESAVGPPPKTWTPLYASPEMLAGVAPDPRDDVYSLGCVVYEMLTGRHPWGNLPADEAAHLNLKVTKPASLSAQRWKALQRALAFRAAARPADGAAFLRAFFLPAGASRGLPWVAAAVLAVIAVSIALWPDAPPAPPRVTPPVVELPPVETLPDDAQQDSPALGEATGSVESGPPDAVPAEPPPQDAAIAAEVGAPAETGPPAEQPATPPPPRRRPAALAFPAATLRIPEAGGALRLELLRPANYRGPLQVLWRTLDRTAVDGVHYAGSSVWQWTGASAAAESLVILIPIVDDSLPGPDRVFVVELQQVPDGPPVGEPARVEVTIVDDD